MGRPLVVRGEPSVRSFMLEREGTFSLQGRVERIDGRARLRWRERTCEGRSRHRSRDLADEAAELLAGVLLGWLRQWERMRRRDYGRRQALKQERRRELRGLKRKIRANGRLSIYRRRQLIRYLNQLIRIYPRAAPEELLARCPPARPRGRPRGPGRRHETKAASGHASLW